MYRVYNGTEVLATVSCLLRSRSANYCIVFITKKESQLEYRVYYVTGLLTTTSCLSRTRSANHNVLSVTEEKC